MHSEMSGEQGRDVVADFWRGVDQHDWALIESTLADNVVRIGMRDNAEDTCEGKGPYMEFITGVIGRMDHHDLRTLWFYYSPDRRRAVHEAIETIAPPGEEPLSMRFINIMEIDEQGLISKIDIFWKTPVRMPPDWITVEEIASSVG